MTPLRQRLIEDLQLRGMSARTPERYVRAVRQLAEHYHPSPDCLTEEDLRQYFLSLNNVQHASRRATTIALCGSKVFSDYTLPSPWPTLTCVRPPHEHKLPTILSIEDVRTILQQVRFPRDRIGLSTIYACGLRLQEGTPFQVPDSARARMVVHVRCGTGAQDRSVPFAPQTLTALRTSWQTPRQPLWLLPAPGRGGIGMATASTPRPRHSVQDALRAARKASGLRKRAAGHPLRHSSAPPLLEAGVHLRLLQEYVGHHAPTTTALSTPLTATAATMARETLPALLADL